MRWEVLALLAVLAFALMVRAWQLERSLLLSIDEANFVSDMQLFWDSPDVQLLQPMTGVVPFTRLHTYWSSWSVEVVGRTWAGLRGASVVIGVLTVAGVWLLARNAFDRVTGITAALMLAAFPPHVHFSRLVLNNITDPLFGVLAMGFVARGLRSGTRLDYALGGVMLGLTAYFYEAGRLFFPVLMASWLGWLWLRSLLPRTDWRFPYRGALVLLAAFVITIGPVYYVILALDIPLASRFAQAGRASPLDALLGQADAEMLAEYRLNLKNAFLYYVKIGESFVHYGQEQPLVPGVMIPALVLGVAFALLRLFRQVGMALALGWIFGAALGTSLMPQSMVSTRYVIVFPALALLMGIGIRGLFDAFAPRLPHTQDADAHRARFRFAPFAAVVPVVVAAGFALWGAEFYHYRHLPAFETEIREINPQYDVDDAIRRAATLPPGTHITVVTERLSNGQSNRDMLLFFTEGLTIYTTFVQHIIDGEEDDYFAGLDTTQRQAFLIPPRDEVSRAKIEERFTLPPSAAYSPFDVVPPNKQLAMYVVEPVVIAEADSDDAIMPDTDNGLPPDEPAADAPVADAQPPETVAPVAALEPWNARHGRELRVIGQVALAGGLLALAGYGGLSFYAARRTRPAAAAWAFARLAQRTKGEVTAYGLAWGATVLLLLAAYGFQPERTASTNTAALLLLAALLVFGAAAALRTRVLPELLDARDIPAQPPVTVRRNGQALALGGVLLALVVSINTGGWPQPTPAAVQLAFLVGGWGLVTYGFIRVRPGEAVPVRALSITCGEWLALGAILLVALGVRVHDLEYLLHRFMDEIHFVGAIVALWEDPNTPILTQHGNVTAFTWLYPMLQSAGEFVYGPTLTALRVVSAFFGVAGVAALWWLGRILFNPRVALLAALLLATFPPHVHFSRLGLNNIADPLFGVLMLAFLARGLRDGRQSDFALAGLMLGLTQYFYEGGRLFYPPLALAFVGVWIWLRSTPADPDAAPGAQGRTRLLSVTLLVGLVVAAPVYLTWLSDPEADLLPRFSEQVMQANHWAELRGDTARDTADRMLRNLRGPFLHLVQHPEGGWFYGGRTALVLPLLVPFLLAGLLAAFWRVRAPGAGWRGAASPGMALLLVWVIAAAVANSLLHASTEAPRYVVMHPAVVLLMALGAAHLARMLTTLPGRAVRGWAGVALLVFGLAAGIYQTRYYFHEHIPQYRDANLELTFADDMIFRMANLPPARTHVYIVSDEILWLSDVQAWLQFNGRDDITFEVIDDSERITEDWLVSLLPGRTVAFFVEPDEVAVRDLLDAALSTLRVHPSPYGLPEDQQYRLYYVECTALGGC